MTNTDKHFIESWEKTKAKGRLHYALQQGPIQGVLIVIVISLFKLSDQSFAEVYFSTSFFLSILLYAGIFFLVYYTIMWWFNNFLYRKKTEQK